jgi:hypothetical protein
MLIRQHCQIVELLLNRRIRKERVDFPNISRRTHRYINGTPSLIQHPSGLFVAVSFSSGFKVFAIVNDKLEVLKDIQIPNCKLIKYSHGGHFLAVN